MDGKKVRPPDGWPLKMDDKGQPVIERLTLPLQVVKVEVLDVQTGKPTNEVGLCRNAIVTGPGIMSDLVTSVIFPHIHYDDNTSALVIVEQFVVDEDALSKS